MSANTRAAPSGTLRLQLHKGYTLDDARQDLPYFSRLGISHLYLSPVSRSRPGSTHGYDVVDHGEIDPERGGEAALRRLAAAAHASGMGILLDIVPNHMATDPANAGWWDVLRHGPDSDWAEWFDIDWHARQCRGKVLAPFLAKHYADALRCGDICLRHNTVDGLHIAVHDVPYPLAPGGPQAADGLETVLASFDTATAPGRDRLHALLEQQHYRLAWWRTAADAINWRRFFEVTGLIGVRVERPEVFEAVHRLPLSLYAEGVIDGLRVDHVDGLAHPLDYCRRLRRAMNAARSANGGAPAPWLVVEKILAEGETLDGRWDVSGTTGYDFMADVGALLHDVRGEAPLFEAWTRISGDGRPAHAWLVDARREMLERHFAAERNGLLDALTRLAQCDAATRDWMRTMIGRVLDALLRHFPTYRSYVEDGARAPEDQRWFRRAVRDAQAAGRSDRDTPYDALLKRLDDWLGGRPADSETARTVLRRFQQLTPPLAAKSLEDTVFYRYGCLLSRNDVGSDPAEFALSPEDFHVRNQRRAQLSPGGLLATATHDHKRGEDVRARLAVLSEIPEDWLQASNKWLGDASADGAAVGADRAFRYMLLQMLVGAWPPALKADDADGMNDYLERIGEWAVKALREGKQRSSWFEPDLAHEAECLRWLEMLRAESRRGVLREMEEFVQRIEPAAIANGLVQTALRMTCPGIPDLYQGTEFRDFSLVDPDNRRPVDFAVRDAALRAAVLARQAGPAGAPLLAPERWPPDAWSDGRVKQALVALLLRLRSERPTPFNGDYRPLDISGPCGDRLVAFARGGGDVVVVAAVKCASRLRMAPDGVPLLPDGYWETTAVSLPAAPGGWHEVLRGRPIPATRRQQLRVGDLLAGFPLAVLHRDQG